MNKTNGENRKYLYAIVACPDRREFKTRGIGERGDAVYTIPYRDLAAVVSDTVSEKYENSRRNMMAHMLVLEEVMESFDPLPVRFGTVAPSAEAVETRLLMPRLDEFRHLLGQMQGRVELGLKVFWFEGVAFAEMVRENGTVRRLRDALEGRPLGETYYERIRLGEEVAKALTDKRAHDEEMILSRFQPFVHKTKTNKIISDRMIVNAAFLVNRDNETKVDEAVKKLDDDLRSRAMCKYVGPVPPYNFVNIVVNW